MAPNLHFIIPRVTAGVLTPRIYLIGPLDNEWPISLIRHAGMVSNRSEV